MDTRILSSRKGHLKVCVPKTSLCLRDRDFISEKHQLWWDGRVCHWCIPHRQDSVQCQPSRHDPIIQHQTMMTRPVRPPPGPVTLEPMGFPVWCWLSWTQRKADTGVLSNQSQHFLVWHHNLNISGFTRHLKAIKHETIYRNSSYFTPVLLPFTNQFRRKNK